MRSSTAGVAPWARPGAFFSYQRGLFEVSGSIFWGDYRYGEEAIFDTAGDRNDPEFVVNDLSLLVFEADFVWAHWFTRWLAATYGAGLGLAVVLGEVRRTEATPPTGPTPTSPRGDQWIRPLPLRPVRRIVDDAVLRAHVRRGVARQRHLPAPQIAERGR